MQAIAVALSCLPEIAGRSLLLKTTSTLDTGLRGINLDLTQKPPP